MVPLLIYIRQSLNTSEYTIFVNKRGGFVNKKNRYGRTVGARFDRMEIAYIDKIVREAGLRNRAEYIRFAVLHSGMLARIRRSLRESGVIVE